MIVIFIELVAIIIGLYVFFMLSYSMLRGAPYAASTDEKIDTMISLLDIKKGEKAVDLGSGDGKIVIALAKAGAKAYGYEINPLYVLLSRYYIRREHVEKDVTIYWKSFWGANLSSYSVVTLFATPHIMRALSRKIQKDCKQGTRVVSNHFTFPNWDADRKKSNVILYKI